MRLSSSRRHAKSRASWLRLIFLHPNRPRRNLYHRGHSGTKGNTTLSLLPVPSVVQALSLRSWTRNYRHRWREMWLVRARHQRQWGGKQRLLQRIGRRLRLRRPDSLGLDDRPSPIFIGTGGDPDIFVKCGGAEGLGVGLEVIEQRHVGTPLDGDGRDAFGGGNHTRTRGHFGVFSGLAFERQADGDFAKVPVSSIEYVQLQGLILNGTGAVEL